VAFSPVIYLKNSWAELKKVTWPTRQQALLSTARVIVFSIIVSAFLGLLDYLFTLGLNIVIEQLNK
jgi:preprotein translocase subunit SecE